jgi:hypothetical protein
VKAKPKARTTTQPRFDVRRYAIKWTSADPSYDYVYRLVPIITLYESETDDGKSGAVAFLQFRRDDHVRGASYDPKRNIYYLDYPLSFASEVLHLVESGLPLTLTYKVQETRKWAELETKPQPLIHGRNKR